MNKELALFIGVSEGGEVVLTRKVKARDYDFIEFFISGTSRSVNIRRRNILHLKGKELDSFLRTVHSSIYDKKYIPAPFEATFSGGHRAQFTVFKGYIQIVFKYMSCGAYLHVPKDLFSTDLIDFLPAQNMKNTFYTRDVYEDESFRPKKHPTKNLNLDRPSYACIINTLSDSEGMTSKEISLILGKDMNQITSRVSELTRKGVLEMAGWRDSQGNTHTGKLWRLTKEYRRSHS